MIEKSTLEQLYLEKKLSMVEVAQRLGTTHHKVEWWMQKYSIPRRHQRDATYHKRNPNGDPFSIKATLTYNESLLLGLGLGLFWGEGNKASLNAVRLGNTDPRVIKTFVRFLREICRVQESKIRFALQIFDDIDEKTAVDYWLKELNVTRDRFSPKVVVSPKQGKGTYTKRSEFGVVTVLVCNSKLRQWLGEQIGKVR